MVSMLPFWFTRRFLSTYNVDEGSHCGGGKHGLNEPCEYPKAQLRPRIIEAATPLLRLLRMVAALSTPDLWLAVFVDPHPKGVGTIGEFAIESPLLTVLDEELGDEKERRPEKEEK
jgi:hypothetical protein